MSLRISEDPRWQFRKNELETYSIPEGGEKEFLYSTLIEPVEAEICFCGHPKKSHVQLCKVDSYSCACEGYKLAVVTSDPRPFFQISEGPGEEHALQKALNVCERLGILFEYAVPRTCKNGFLHGEVTIVGLSKHNSFDFNHPKRSAWLCKKCFDNIRARYYQKTESPKFKT